MGQYVDTCMKINTYNKIIDIIRDTTVDLDDYYDIEDRVELVQFLEELQEEDSEKKNKEYIQWKKNREQYDIIKKEYKDLINKLYESFDVKENDLYYLLCSVTHLFLEWKCEYLLVASFFYLSTKDDSVKITDKWSLLSEFNLPIEELVFFYGTIIKNEATDIEF